MKIVFMGTPDFALACLKAITDSRHEVIAAITQPDKPGGRGKKLIFSPVKEFALAANIPLLQPERIKAAENTAMLEKFPADIFVVAAYGQILSQHILDMPRHGAINVHASLLPKYRGASPIQQAIVDGETLTGITIMQMDKGLDTGDIILEHAISIEEHDTGGTLHDKLCIAGAAALLEALNLIETSQATTTPQNNQSASYAPLITKNMAHINWSKPPRDITNLVRAYNPFPGAFAALNRKPVKIWKTENVETLNEAARPGEIIKACPKDGIFVAAQNGAIRIIKLTPSGGKKMTSADYVKGHDIKAGDIFE